MASRVFDRVSDRVSEKIPDKLYFKIGEVARLLGIKASVLRYWETEFPSVAPRKSSTNERVYRRSEVESLFVIRRLLYEEKYSIAGARRCLSSAPRSAPVPEGGRAVQIKRLITLVQELESLARTPISSLFHL